MSNYLLELSVIHVAFMLGYWFFLRKEGQYAKMRLYLIGTTLLALTIPLLKLPKLLFGSKEPIEAILMETVALDAMALTPTPDVSTWNYDLLIWMYIAICGFFLFKFFSSVLKLIYLERKSSYEKFNNLYIRRVSNIKGSFTFFNWIFLSDEIDKNQQDYHAILKHEKAHACLGHTYDLVFFELFKVCFWWLPTTWFIINEIKTVHEYQADYHALKTCNVEQYSTILITSTLKTNGLILTSSFHDGLILKRLKAMKQQVKNVSPWKLGALSALGVLLFIVFACSEELENKEIGNQEEVFTAVEELPEFEGGMDAFYKYIGKEIRYPLKARQTGVEGQVDVQFVVEKDGSLSNVKAIKGIGADCDDEAVRVIQNVGSFKPGTQRGKQVRVRMILSINFKLNQGKTNPDKTTQGMIILDELSSNNIGKLQVDARYANGEWSGTVYDEQGEGLPGANVVVAGTTNGTASDLDGTFKVKAYEAKDLLVSFVGYESVKVEGK